MKGIKNEAREIAESLRNAFYRSENGKTKSLAFEKLNYLLSIMTRYGASTAEIKESLKTEKINAIKLNLEALRESKEKTSTAAESGREV